MKRPREATLKFEAKYDVGFVDNDGDVHPVIVNDDSREEIVSTGPDGPIKDPKNNGHLLVCTETGLFPPSMHRKHLGPWKGRVDDQQRLLEGQANFWTRKAMSDFKDRDVVRARARVGAGGGGGAGRAG